MIHEFKVSKTMLLSGLNTWNKDDNHVDIETELTVIADCAPPGEEARGGEKTTKYFHFSSTKLSFSIAVSHVKIIKTSNSLNVQ